MPENQLTACRKLSVTRRVDREDGGARSRAIVYYHISWSITSADQFNIIESVSRVKAWIMHFGV